MKTDKLIDMLGTNVEPVKGGQLRNTLLFGLVVGVAAALCLTLALFGTPVGIFGAEDLGVRMLTLTFTLGLAVAGVSFLIKAARPGKPVRKPLLLIGILFTVILLGGIVALAFAHPVAWGGNGLWTGMGGLPPLHSVIRHSAVPVARLGFAQRGAHQPQTDRRGYGFGCRGVRRGSIRA